MATFLVRARKLSGITDTEIEATSREDAITQVIGTAVEGEEIQVLDVKQTSADPAAGATGATGATGTARMAAGASEPVEARTTRAQLNEMSKEELLAVAEKEGADVSPNWNKADIIDAIVKRKAV